MNQPVCNIENW